MNEYVVIARDAITCVLEGKQITENNNYSDTKGCFVTLTKEGNLRGCIGYITSTLPLGQALQKAAISAAFHDPRFPPVTQEEFSTIDIEVSVLTVPQVLGHSNISTLRAGIHGLIISRGLNSGLLLPQVFSTETPEEMLAMTCQKAGLHKNAWKDPKTVIHVFEVSIHH